MWALITTETHICTAFRMASDSKKQHDCLTQLVSGRARVSWSFIVDLFFPPGQNCTESSTGSLSLSGLVLLCSEHRKCWDINRRPDQLYLPCASYLLIEPGFWLNSLLKIHFFLLPHMALIYCQSDSLEVPYFLFQGHRGGQHGIFSFVNKAAPLLHCSLFP